MVGAIFIDWASFIGEECMLLKLKLGVSNLFWSVYDLRPVFYLSSLKLSLVLLFFSESSSLGFFSFFLPLPFFLKFWTGERLLLLSLAGLSWISSCCLASFSLNSHFKSVDLSHDLLYNSFFSSPFCCLESNDKVVCTTLLICSSSRGMLVKDLKWVKWQGKVSKDIVNDEIVVLLGVCVVPDLIWFFSVSKQFFWNCSDLNESKGSRVELGDV